MFRNHLLKVEGLNEQKAFGGKNSKHDKNDKVYRDIAQLQIKISKYLFYLRGGDFSEHKGKLMSQKGKKIVFLNQNGETR